MATDWGAAPLTARLEWPPSLARFSALYEPQKSQKTCSKQMAHQAMSHGDYTIAWICALPLEMAAAKLMLDELHERLPQPVADQNCYTLGSIHGHNIVIACLPSGVYGTISATIVLAQMLPTFPALRFGLMVGIGGGVPTKADVRLGDVVVGIPNASSSGVIQYDFGKTMHSGRFERMGLLNKPPQVLLTAVSQLRSAFLLGKGSNEFALSISNVLEKGRGQEKDHAVTSNPTATELFSRPDEDRLFISMYTHSGPNNDCSTCDQDQLVYRDTRGTSEPHIHFGLIASGNQVMRDARTRDSIAQELDILCFEMEAAGLMDQLPCLVIRGVCDYSDSHKSDDWQGYSALAAAAYTRSLLKMVPANEEKPTTEQPPWIVPFSRNPGFVGREEQISILEESILRPTGPLKTAMCGLGGIGKTQIALELAYRIRARDREFSIFWIPCTSYEGVEQAYMNVGRTLGLAQIDPSAIKQQVTDHLSNTNAGKWLIIFDNADDMEMWMELKGLLPRSEAGRILFTTRNRKLAVKLASSNVVQIPDLDERTAVRMVEKLLIDKSLLLDKEAVAELLRQLCFLPLAISQATAYINENSITVSDYLSLLAAQEEDTVELLSEDFEDDGRYSDIQNPVIKTWLISFHQIRQLNKLAVDYLSIMACVNPRDIPQLLLPVVTSRKQRIDALGLLKAYSFITEQTGSGAITLHRLVYLATRNWMRKDGIFASWMLKTVDRISEVFPGAVYTERDQWREYLPHVLSVTMDNEFRPVLSKYHNLLREVGWCLYRDGRYEEAKGILSDLLGDMQNTLGKDHAATLATMSALGVVLIELGELDDARKLQEYALEGRTRLNGPDHPDTLKNLSMLGLVYHNQGKFEKARLMQQQALQGLEKVLGPNDAETLASLTNLGSDHLELGRYDEATSMYELAMERYTRVHGPDHPDALTAAGNFAALLLFQGKYEMAEKAHRQVLQRRETNLGPEHPDTLSSIDNLAWSCSKQGKFEEAEGIWRSVLETRRRVLGSEHHLTMRTNGCIAQTLIRQGRYEEAKTMLHQGIEKSNKVYGPDHPDTLADMSHLAEIYWYQGMWPEAEELEIRVLDARKRVLGADDPHSMISMQNLALTWNSMGKHDDALNLTSECLALRIQHLGTDNPHTVFSRNTLTELQQTVKHVPAHSVPTV